MGLHQELTTNFTVIVNYEVLDSGFVKLFTYCKPGRSCSNNCNSRFPYFYLFSVTLNQKSILRKIRFVNSFYIFDLIHLGYANASNFSVNQHFACTTFSNAALHCALSVLKTVFVNNFSGLMQCCRNRKPSLTVYFLPFEDEFHSILRRNWQDRMLSNSVHS